MNVTLPSQILPDVVICSTEPPLRSDYPGFVRTKKFVSTTIYRESKEWDFDSGLVRAGWALLFRNRSNERFSTASPSLRTCDSVQGFSCLS
jgi:hypothetical protein